MSVRWLLPASRDMKKLIEWHEENAPDILPDTAQKIWDASLSLNTFPNRGRPGFIKGTRELLIPRLPYMLVYTFDGSNVNILRLLHQHQNWPDE